MKKRVLSMLLALVMSLSLAAPAFAAEEQVPPADVTEAPAAEAVVEEPAEAPAEEPAEEPVEAPVEEPAEEPTEPAPDGTVAVDVELVEGSVADAMADEPVSVEEAEVVIADAPDGGIMMISSLDDLKVSLNNAVDIAKPVLESTKTGGSKAGVYTDASVQALETALKNATDLQEELTKANNGVTSDEILKVTEALENATAVKSTRTDAAGLDPFATEAELQALKSQLDSAEAIRKNGKDKYTTDSWDRLEREYRAAMTAYEGEQHQNVLAATTALKAANGGMVDNVVSGKILKGGYFATAQQAQVGLAAQGAADASDCNAPYEMYVVVQRPDTNDSHRYYLNVNNGSRDYGIKPDISFNGKNAVVHWNATQVGLTLKDNKLDNGTTVTCTLYSYIDNDAQREQVGEPVTITINSDLEGPRFVPSGCRWTQVNGNNVMQIQLDVPNTVYGVLLKLSDGVTEVNLRTSFTGTAYSWTWDEEKGSFDKAPDGTTLKVGTYKASLYPYVLDGNGSAIASATAVDTVEIEVPAVDVKPLQMAYDNAVERYPDLETKWVPQARADELKKALDEGKKLIDAAASTPETLDAVNKVNAAISAINQAAAEGLLQKKADYSALDAAISKAQAIVDANKDLATSDTLKNLNAALAKAKNIDRELPAGSQTTIDTVVKELNDAIDNLQEKPANWNGFDGKLVDARNKLGSANNYTAASKQALQSAVDAAAAFKAANAGLTMSHQDLVNAQTEALDAAIKGLLLRANTTALSAAITKAEGLDQSKYVDCTAVLSALKTAKDLLATDPDGSKQTDVDAAAKALNDAIAALEEIHVTGEHNAAEGGRWQQTGGTWYWIQANGSVLKDSWLVYKGQWYYLAQGTGAMATGWAKVDGLWYWFDGDGAMATGWLKSGGLWYFLSGSGAMLTGWVKADGQMYYLNPTQGANGLPEGAMVTGWLQSAGAWYWLNPTSGAHGRPEGAMVTNDWQYTGGLWYWLNANGDMAKGWKAVGGVWYYLNPTEGNDGLPEGGMYSNKWLLDDGKWYYLGSSGAMFANDAYTIGGQVYRFNGSGVMVTGWFQNGNWYYYNKGGNGVPEGALIKSKWINTDEHWFYVDGEGRMLTGMQTINGREYYLTAAGDSFGLPLGAMVTNRWVTVGTTRRYYGPDGVLVTSTTNTTVTGTTGTTGNT